MRAFRQTIVSDARTLAALSPSVERPKLYRLQAGEFRLTHAALQLGPDLVLDDYCLLKGALRIGGVVLRPQTFALAFIETDEARIQGTPVRVAMALCLGGARLEGAAYSSGRALALTISETLGGDIIPEGLPDMWRRSGSPDKETVLFPVTPTGLRLKEALERVLRGAQQGRFGPDDRQVLIERSAATLHEIASGAPALETPHAERRRILARDVEQLLWESPLLGVSRRLSLDDAAKRLRRSRRSIQLALHEELGLGFVALKRAIRLHQVHAILKVEPRQNGIGQIAKAHEFNHLSRFARHYREMFGVLPSIDHGPHA